MARKSSGGTPATVALGRAGVAFTLHSYEHDPGVTSRSLRRAGNARLDGYGLEAAAALSVDPARVFKTLIADVDGRLAVGIVPVSGQLNLKALARALGGSRATMADQAVAERSSGYVVGGISPFGQKRQLPTVLDESALTHDTVLVSAGRRGLDLEIAPADLVRVLAATLAQIGRP